MWTEEDQQDFDKWKAELIPVTDPKLQAEFDKIVAEQKEKAIESREKAAEKPKKAAE